MPPHAKEDPQRVPKAHLIASSLALGGMDAMALSASDWTLGRKRIQDLVTKHKLPVLAANLICDDEHPYPDSVVLERGGKRIGIVGITDGPVAGCTVEDPVTVANEAMDKLGAVDFRLVLAPIHRTKLAELNADAVVDGNNAAMYHQPLQVGSAWVLSNGSRGKHLGTAELTWQSDATTWVAFGATDPLEKEVDRLSKVPSKETKARQEHRLQMLADKQAQLDVIANPPADQHWIRHTLTELDDTIADEPAVARIVSEGLAAFEGADVAAAASTEPRVGPTGSDWAGAKACESCHRNQTYHWAQTPHARAWQSLVDDGHAGDNSCFSCHSTGANKEGGPATAAAVSGLRDVQCEACHGAAAKHIADPQTKPTKDPSIEVCTGCHDGDRDGGRFDFDSYRKLVEH